MSEKEKDGNLEVPMTMDNLFREVTVTDMKAGGIKMFVPIDVDGNDVEDRDTLFVGIASVMTPQGPVQIQAMMPGVDSLEKAVVSFGEAIENRIEEMVAEAEKQAQDEASRIIMPDDTVNGSGPNLTMVK